MTRGAPSAAARAAALLLAGVLSCGAAPRPASAASDTQIALERRIWAEPDLAGSRARVEAGAGGGWLVRLRVPDSETARAARRLLGSDPEVADLQVEVEPRLRRPEPAADAATALERVRRALAADAGTRRHADRTAGARVLPPGVLVLTPPPGSSPLPAAEERRLVRLARAQPGILAVVTEASEGAGLAPRRTRIAIEASEPEAIAPGPAVASPEQAPPRAEARPAPTGATRDEAAADPAGDEVGPIDAAVEELLRRGLALVEGAGSVRVRVRRGVATLSGEVADRATAERLRAHVLDADGVRAVAGRVELAGTGESFAMDGASE